MSRGKLDGLEPWVRLRVASIPPLTPKQREAADLRAAGMSIAEIARQLGISRPTVKQRLKPGHRRKAVSDYLCRRRERERAERALPPSNQEGGSG